MLTEDQRRELALKTMASWALDGLEPDRQTVEDNNSYIDGRMTVEELVEKSKSL